jgi:hypothetical protein
LLGELFLDSSAFLFYPFIYGRLYNVLQNFANDSSLKLENESVRLEITKFWSRMVMFDDIFPHGVALILLYFVLLNY